MFPFSRQRKVRNGPPPGSAPVRPGEELAIGAVDDWLRQRLPGLSGPPEVKQFSGGASNWTYRLRYPGHDLVLRRPPAGTKAKSAHDMGREFRVQSALRPVFPYVPDMIAFCDDPAVIGCDFYVMRHIDGLIPRATLGAQLSAEDTRRLCLNVIDVLVALHRIDPKHVGLQDLGRGPGYVHRQVKGWSDRYRKARTWNVPRFERIMSWLERHAPHDVAACIVHNDYRLDNVVLDRSDPTKVIGVLDWEMATIGDPLMDLGGSLAYWVQADDDAMGQSLRRQPTHLPGMLKRREVVEYYCGQMGLPTSDMAFYQAFGLFRLAVIAQQIYYRYHHRQTRNPAFRRLWTAVHYLHYKCWRVILGGAG